MSIAIPSLQSHDDPKLTQYAKQVELVLRELRARSEKNDTDVLRQRIVTLESEVQKLRSRIVGLENS